MTGLAASIGARLVAIVLLGIGVAVLVWALFIRPGQLKADAALQKAGATVAVGEAAKANDARQIVENTHEITRTIERQTVTNERLIRAAPGAGDLVADDVDRAGRAALCLRASYQSDPACNIVPGPDPKGVD